MVRCRLKRCDPYVEVRVTWFNYLRGITRAQTMFAMAAVAIAMLGLAQSTDTV